MPREVISTLKDRLKKAVFLAVDIDRMERDEEARAIWFEVYPLLSAGQPGLFGAVTARSEAQVLRLSMLYALLDGSRIIRRPHLLAALAVWEYVEESARFIFGTALGDPTADQILKALQQSQFGLSRTEISSLFGRHRSANDIERALQYLFNLGLVEKDCRQTEGRPMEVWVFTDGAKKAKYAN
jgi:DNA-binding transcriptional ArsR family regulator